MSGLRKVQPATDTIAEVVHQMFNPLNYPFLVLVLLLLTFWSAARIGDLLRARRKNEDNHEDFLFVIGGTLTLLGLLIGFSFSMAVNRYDQRKNYEAQEANAIGTAYNRADLLPAADASKVRSLLTSYLNQRIFTYNSGTEQQYRQNNAQTAPLQSGLWSAVTQPAAIQPNPIGARILDGINDVLSSQAYAQAAWRNRIPIAAWILLTAISILCNLLLGYSAHGRSAFLLFVLPVALSISLFLIADIDSPYRGVIRVAPQNLEGLAESLRSQ